MVNATMAWLYPMDSDFMDVMIPENLPMETLVDEDTVKSWTPVEEQPENEKTQEVLQVEATGTVDDSAQTGQPDDGEDGAHNSDFLARWGIVIGVSFCSLSLLAVLVGVYMARTRKRS